MTSLASSTPTRRKKGRAPAIPTASTSSLSHIPGSPLASNGSTPTLRKRRPAPAPPIPLPKAPVEEHQSSLPTIALDEGISVKSDSVTDASTDLLSSIENVSVSDTMDTSLNVSIDTENDMFMGQISPSQFAECTNLHVNGPQQKIIPLGQTLLDDSIGQNVKELDGDDVVYRRTIVPLEIMSPVGTISGDRFEESFKAQSASSDRQWEKVKENKESLNKNRQSQVSLTPSTPGNTPEADAMFAANKSSHGKWKRRKGPAPSLPVPPRKVLQMLPLQEIRHELEVIEVQQLGLEKQVGRFTGIH